MHLMQYILNSLSICIQIYYLDNIYVGYIGVLVFHDNIEMADKLG